MSDSDEDMEPKTTTSTTTSTNPNPTNSIQKSEVDDLFDDDDDDSDEEMMTVNNNNNTNKDESQEKEAETEKKDDSGEDENDDKKSSNETKNGNAANNALFGSDDDDSDDSDDEEMAGDLTNTPNNKDTTNAPQKEEAKDATSNHTKLETGNHSEDEDEDFQGDNAVIGKTPSTPSSSQTNTKQTFKQNLTLPNMPLPPKSKDTSFHITALPKIVSIQSDPFDKVTHNAKHEQQRFKGEMHNMIRWRYQKDKERDATTGKVKKESNAKIIKWSDGSYGLRVGDEMFELDEMSFLLNGKS